MNNELKSCPFCGGPPKKTFIGNEHTKRRSIEIQCQKCRIKRVDAALIQSHEWLDEVATRYWNERVPSDELIHKLKSCENCDHKYMSSGFIECKFIESKSSECLQDYKYWELMK